MTDLTYVNDSVFTVRDFLSAEECDQYIQLTESHGFSHAPITTMLGPQHCPDVRNNTRVMIDDAGRANELWSRVEPYVDMWEQRWKPIGLNERFRYYRYDVGEQFNWHYDGCYERSNGERSWLTFMVYLNEEFSGGATEFEDVSVQPRTGMALFFVHAILHRGAPVTDGRKYVLRSDVMYRLRRPGV
ncbi:MAG: 2OG-Fe(II) oxygenase [Planctomycetota bacterium]